MWLDLESSIIFTVLTTQTGLEEQKELNMSKKLGSVYVTEGYMPESCTEFVSST